MSYPLFRKLLLYSSAVCNVLLNPSNAKKYWLFTLLTLILTTSTWAAVYPDTPFDFANESFPDRPALMNTTDGTRLLDMVVIFIQLDGFDYTAQGIDFIDDRIFSPTPSSESIAKYLVKASHGRVSLRRARETNGTHNDGIIIVDGGAALSGLPNNAEWRRLGLELADADIDYSSYDTNADGRVSQRELTIEVIVGDSSYLGGQDGGTTNSAGELDGVRLNRSVALAGMFSGDAIISHEYMHQAYQHTDLYGYGIGNWDIMGGIMGTSAYTKLLLGWTNPTVVSRDGWYQLRNSLDFEDMLLLYNPDRGTDEFFLVQNRVASGTRDFEDSADSGLLIQRVDGSQWRPPHPGEPPVETIRPDGIRNVPSCSENSILATEANAGDRSITVEKNYFTPLINPLTPLPLNVILRRDGETDLEEIVTITAMEDTVLTLSGPLELSHAAGTMVYWPRLGFANYFATELAIPANMGDPTFSIKRLEGTLPTWPFKAIINGSEVMISSVSGSTWTVAGSEGLGRSFDANVRVKSPWDISCTFSDNKDGWDTADGSPSTFDATWGDESDARINLYGIGPAAETTEVYVDVPSSGAGMYLERKVVHRMEDISTLVSFPWIVANTGDDTDTFRLRLFQRDGVEWERVDTTLTPGDHGIFDVQLRTPFWRSGVISRPEGLELRYHASSFSDSSVVSEGVLPIDWPFWPERAYYTWVSRWEGTGPDPRIFSTAVAGPGVTRSATAIYSGYANQSELTISPLNDSDKITVVLPNLADELRESLPSSVPVPAFVSECGNFGGYMLPGPFGEETLELRSMLEVKIIPKDDYHPPFDDLTVIGEPRVSTPRLMRYFDCPYGNVTALGFREVNLDLYPLEERIQRYAYDIETEYKVQILRVPENSIYQNLPEGDGRGISCAGGFFPICEPDAFGQFLTPLPPVLRRPSGCPADGCPDHFPFSWQGGDAKALEFSAPPGTNISVLDAFGNFIAEAFPRNPVGQTFSSSYSDGLALFLPPADLPTDSHPLAYPVMNSLPPDILEWELSPPSSYIPDPVVPIRVIYDLYTEQFPQGLYFLRVQIPADFDSEADPSPVMLSWQPTDSDGDGRLPQLDNCSAAFNPDQSDSDNDGVGDACDDDDDNDQVHDEKDNCPLIVNPDQLDTESDGIGDACDNCINTVNPDQADENGDELGDACDTGDSDNDGMPDNYEYRLNLQAGVHDGKRDDDNDGVVNIDEHKDGTNPVPMCGDLSDDTYVELDDLIHALLVLSGDSISTNINGDCNYDNRIGMSEAFSILQDIGSGSN